MMKKMLVFMLTMALAVVLSACSKEESATIEASKSPKEMIDQMVTEIEQPAFMELSEEELQNLYNIDPAKLEEYSVRIPMMGVKTNEIAILKVKDAADVADVKAALETRADNVMKTFEQYLPDQYEQAKNYKIVVKGNYVLFLISDRADDLIKVYDSFFEQK